MEHSLRSFLSKNALGRDSRLRRLRRARAHTSGAKAPLKAGRKSGVRQGQNSRNFFQAL